MTIRPFDKLKVALSKVEGRRAQGHPELGRGVRHIRALLMRLGGLFGKARRDREFGRELESHLQMQMDDNLRAGMTPEETRRQALMRFNGIESVKEAYRDRRGIPLLETTLQDARYAVRTLRRNPGANMVGILVMALAIGANTAVFSVVHAVLLNPLPYANPDRIVTLTSTRSSCSVRSEASCIPVHETTLSPCSRAPCRSFPPWLIALHQRK